MTIQKSITLASFLFVLTILSFFFFDSSLFVRVEKKVVNEFKPKEYFDPLSFTWGEIDSDVPWGGRDSHMVYEFKEKMFLFGGLDGTKGIVSPKNVIYEKADQDLS